MAAIGSAIFALPIAAVGAADQSAAIRQQQSKYYLPDAAASRTVTVARDGTAANQIIVLTQAIAVKETGPKATVSKFGEVYSFSPSFLALHREEATILEFWNLQPDDEHDFMLVDSDSRVLMHIKLPPLKKTSYVFTFHQSGLFNFYCTVHQPEMSGQILVLPPVPQKPR
jgi:plastocyanin